MRLALAFASLSAAVVAQTPPAERPLFDGRSLAGWRGDERVWRVEADEIVGSTEGAPRGDNTFLVLDGREPANFELTVWVRLTGDNNSGVQYRSRMLPGDGFRVAGYQCDVHADPRYTAMLYDEQGAGIVAQRGQGVVWRDDGRSLLEPLHRLQPVDFSRRQSLRIVAMGDTVWHELGGQVTTVVVDRRAAAPRSGVLALQVHGGAPMTVRFAAPALREWSDLAAMRVAVPVPEAVRAVQRLADARPRAATATPQWLWDDAPQDGEELFLRRELRLDALPDAAELAVSCDNHCRVFVNGERVGASDSWETLLRVDVAKALRIGDNILAVHAWNDGGPAALAVRLAWRHGDQEQSLVSDRSWRCSADDPDGWNEVGFAADGWRAPTVLGALGDARLPWTRVHGHGAFGTDGDPFAPQSAVVATNLHFARGVSASPQHELLRVLEVPRACGSWVALATGPGDTLFASAQGGGLYRVTPARVAGGETRFARVPVALGGAHGLLWFREALYAVVNGKDSGLYRITDTDHDGELDRVELLRALDGEGEHGPHSVVVAADQQHLLVVAGNQTRLPELARSRVAANWAEDRLLPRLDDPNRYWEGHSPPGGWVCQVDADGKEWELLCCGFRNPYDVVVLPATGLPVVFDSDMEWDMGMPWYRPTRLLAVQSGVDYGWRIGSAKWPADYPEAPPALADIGPGSPTGMVLSQQHGWLALDWTFGTVYAGSRPVMVGAPWPVADAARNEHGTWFASGGRGLPSALWFAPAFDAIDCDWTMGGDRQQRACGEPFPWPAVETRDPAAILDALLAANAPPSRAQRVAARVALERAPVAQWRATALAVDARQPARALTGLLALARHGDASDLQPVLDALGALPFAPLDASDRIAWLRVHALALLRLGSANVAQRALLAQRLLPLFPTGDERQDQDLAELLAHVDAPGFVDKAVAALAPLRPSPVPSWARFGTQGDVYGAQYAGVIAAMANAMPPIGQLAIADALRTVRHGWTLQQRRDYFGFLAAARRQKGGASYDGYVKKMIDAAWATCTPAEQEALAEQVGKAKADAPKFAATPPQGPGKDWQLADIDAVLRDGLTGADATRGRNLFHAASCASCHYFAGEGGNHGPDLTSLGNKFSARDVLEAILEPSKVTSEQYAGQVLTRRDGSALFGFATKTHHGDVEVWEVMPAVAGAELVRVPVAEVARIERSPLSPMPSDLVDRLSAAELRDLLAFLLSRGATGK